MAALAREDCSHGGRRASCRHGVFGAVVKILRWCADWAMRQAKQASAVRVRLRERIRDESTGET